MTAERWTSKGNGRWRLVVSWRCDAARLAARFRMSRLRRFLTGVGAGTPASAGSAPFAIRQDPVRLWRAFLEPRFAFGELHSSTRTSWVWRGTENDTGRAVAIKLIKDAGPASRNAFVAEALLLSELEHPGIVRYIAHGDIPEAGGYLVTEWLHGEDVGALLARRRRLSVAQALSLLTRAAHVLAAAHARGVLHLDLKPSNLFLVDDDLGAVRLLDFGIARLMQSASSETVEDSVAGTPGFMAPEQVLGLALAPATDVFALGGLVFRALAGRRIFEGHAPEVMDRTLREPAARLRSLVADVPPALDDLVASMLQIHPAARPPDAASVLSAIASFPSGLLDEMTPSARALLLRQGLTVAERVPITVMLVRAPEGADLAWGRADAGEPARAASFQTLSDGTCIALPSSNATALDQALHAARLALGVRARWPAAAVAIITGRAIGDPRTAQFRDTVVEAQRLLRGAGPGQIVLDPACAGLLAGRSPIVSSTSPPGVLLDPGELPGIASPTHDSDGPCVGREREIDALVAIADDAFTTPRVRTVLVTGPAGIGKSRLVRELLGRCAERRPPPRVWWSYGDSMTARAALGLVADLFASHARGRGARTLEESGSERRRGSGDEAEAGSVDEVHRALLEILHAELGRGSLVLMLEDIHWADIGSLRAIDYVLASLSDRPLLVVATARPEVRDLYPDLWQRRSVAAIDLREIAEPDAARLVTMRLGDAADAATTARIVQRGRGNAFLIHELIQAKVEGRRAETSDTVLGVVQSRLLALDQGARRVLRAASIFGESFAFAGLQRLLGDDSSGGDLRAWLELLCARQVIRRRDNATPNAEASFAFAHALVRDAAYDLLTDSDRELGHRLAAQWLEGAGRGAPVTCAQHYERAGDRGAAGRLYLRAAVEAFEIGDLHATTRAAELALCLELSQHDRGHALAVAAHAHRLTGDVEAARRLSAEALRALPPNTPIWRQAARTAMMAGASKARHRDT
jgi:hypothetical protein